MSGVIPQADDRLVAALVLKAEDTNRGRATEEKSPGAGRQSQPASGDHPDDVSTGKRQDIALDAAHPSDKAIGPGGDVLRRFSVRAAVAEHLPAWPLLEDVLGPLALETAIVPLHQVRIDIGNLPEAGQRAGLCGTLQRTGENPGERKTLQPLAEQAGALLSPFIQR